MSVELFLNRHTFAFIFIQFFKKEFVDAVLQEWYKSMSNLPASLHQAYGMVQIVLCLVFYFRCLDLNCRVISLILFRVWSAQLRWSNICQYLDDLQGLDISLVLFQAFSQGALLEGNSLNLLVYLYIFIAMYCTW
jgi:hypothetical protein